MTGQRTRDEPAASWWISFFAGDLYTRSDLEFLEPALTRQMVACIQALIPRGRLLDLACGPGRHSVPLSQAGYQVTGIDLSEAYLESARQRARSAGQAVEFLRADMRDLSMLPGRSFDAIISMHTSLGFFGSDDENARVWSEVARVLRPGGHLLVDVLNRDWFLHQSGDALAGDAAGHVVRSYDDSGPVIYLHEERFTPLTSRIRWTVREAGGSGRVVTADYRAYSVHEIVGLCGQQGLLVDAVYGGYDRSPFTVFAEHIICLARHPEEQES